jgi:hypothetical protein
VCPPFVRGCLSDANPDTTPDCPSEHHIIYPVSSPPLPGSSWFFPTPDIDGCLNSSQSPDGPFSGSTCFKKQTLLNIHYRTRIHYYHCSSMYATFVVFIFFLFYIFATNIGEIKFHITNQLHSSIIHRRYSY